MKAAIFAFLLCGSALADEAAGLQAMKSGDYATAFKEFLPLASAGAAGAQAYLGLFYGEGLGVQRDYQESVRWYHAAAEQGQVNAQMILAFIYDGSENMAAYRKTFQVDHTEAVKWYRLAAERGNTAAQYFLGYDYAQGIGVPQDFIEAHMWLNLAGANEAADTVQADSIKLRDFIAGRMTPGQIAEAQRRAREWRPQASR